MKCYVCKRDNLKKAVRVMMSAKNRREKDGFRDVCESCYHAKMEREGYVLANNDKYPLVNVWVKKQEAHS